MYSDNSGNGWDLYQKKKQDKHRDPEVFFRSSDRFDPKKNADGWGALSAIEEKPTDGIHAPLSDWFSHWSTNEQVNKNGAYSFRNGGEKIVCRHLVFGCRSDTFG